MTCVSFKLWAVLACVVPQENLDWVASVPGC